MITWHHLTVKPEPIRLLQIGLQLEWTFEFLIGTKFAAISFIGTFKLQVYFRRPTRPVLHLYTSTLNIWCKGLWDLWRLFNYHPDYTTPLPRSRDDESCDTRIEFGGEWWFKRVIIRLKVFLNLGDTLKIFQIRVLSIQILVKIHLPWPGIDGRIPLTFVDTGNTAFSLGIPRWLLLTPVRFKSYMYFYNATGTFFSFLISISLILSSDFLNDLSGDALDLSGGRNF